MKIPTLGKTILVTMRAIEDPGSVSREKLRINKKDSLYNSQKCNSFVDKGNFSKSSLEAMSSSIVAAYAAEYAYRGNYEFAEFWVNRYFKITGEKKQDYFDYIKKEK